MTFLYLILQGIVFRLYYDAIDYQFFIRGASIREFLYLGAIVLSGCVVYIFSKKKTLLTPYTVHLIICLWILTAITAYCLFAFSPWRFVPISGRNGPSSRETIIQPWYFIYLSLSLFLASINSNILIKQKNGSWKQWLLILTPLILAIAFVFVLYIFQSHRPIRNG